MLENFSVVNFRAFRELHLPRLGRLNLIVGRNNTGKSSLLEALRLYAVVASTDTNRAIDAINELLADRDEYERVTGLAGDHATAPLRFASIFHGRASPAPDRRELRVGPVDDPLRIGCSTPFNSRQVVELTYRGSKGSIHAGVWSVPRRAARHRGLWTAADGAPLGPSFVPPGGVHPRLIEAWWDKVSLTDAEERIVESLRLVAPIQRISLVERLGDEGRTRMAVARLEGADEPVPLRALGDGMERIFQIALAMESARDGGLLLLDEVENGIHYSVFPDLWRFIAVSAARNGVQVFATTHSWDCVEGFQRAAAPDSADAMLIRLYARDGDVKGVLLDGADLAIATRDHLEVR